MASRNRHYENMPFKVPENWEWSTLSAICSKIGSGSTPRGSNYSDKGIPFFRSQNVYNDGIAYDDIKYISEEVHQSMISTEVLANDVLLNITGGSLGRCAIVPRDFEKGNVSQHVCILRPIYILPEYLHGFILSSHFSLYMEVSGSGREGLPKYNLEKMFVPIPPLAEQRRIVSQIESWFALIEEIETNKQDLQEAIKQAKSKILSLAIRGRLVAQNTSDEPATELLKRINPNFIPCDTSHYENLPKGWQVAPMQMLCNLTDGEKQNGIKRINLDAKYLRGKGEGVTLIAGKYIAANSTMILVDGENSGEIFTTPIEGYQGSTFKLLNISGEIYKPFIMYVIKSHQKQFRENKVGSAIPHLNKKLFKEIDVLVPPFEEQKRIAQRINDIFYTIDSITADL